MARKLEAYVAMPSVSDVFLIASERVRVEHFARSRQWQPAVFSSGGRIDVAVPKLELAVDEFYARVF